MVQVLRCYKGSEKERSGRTSWGRWHLGCQKEEVTRTDEKPGERKMEPKGVGLCHHVVEQEWARETDDKRPLPSTAIVTCFLR